MVAAWLAVWMWSSMRRLCASVGRCGVARRGMVPRGGENAEARQKWRGKRGKGKGGEDEAEVGERAEGGGGSQEARAWKRGSSRRAWKMETADPSGRAEGAPRDDSYERWSLGLQKRTKAATLTPSERAAPLDDGRAFFPTSWQGLQVDAGVGGDVEGDGWLRAGEQGSGFAGTGRDDADGLASDRLTARWHGGDGWIFHNLAILKNLLFHR